MRPRQFVLTEQTDKELLQKYQLSTDSQTRLRCQAIRLYGQGYPMTEIEHITGCSRRSLLVWCRQYQAHGVARLEDQRAGGNAAQLTPAQLEALDRVLHDYTPAQLFGPEAPAPTGLYWNVPALARLLERRFGVRYRSGNSYRRLLERCGFSYQKAEKVYKSRQESAVIEFEAQVEKLLGDTAQTAPATVILASDEASLYQQATLRRVWNPVAETPIVPVTPDRTKTNFYGTLNLGTGEELAMAAPKMNAATTAAYLQRLLTHYPTVSIVLFWDRAPWHSGEAIRQVLAENPRLKIVYFPTASPDLNPQEHVWKAVRQAVSHNHQFPNLALLAERFLAALTSRTFSSNFLDRYNYRAICAAFI